MRDLIIVVGVVTGIMSLRYYAAYDIGDMICWCLAWGYFLKNGNSIYPIIISQIGFWLSLRQLIIETWFDPHARNLGSYIFAAILVILGSSAYYNYKAKHHQCKATTKKSLFP